MNAMPTVILSSGGLRSLVATATFAKAAHPVLLFIRDGRASEAEHHRAFLAQADHFQIKHHLEIQLPHLYVGDGEERKAVPLAHFQMLTAAAGQAARLNAEKLIWPVSVGEQFQTLSAIAESLVLLEHAVQLEINRPLKIETPLIDLSPRQVIELGRQMQLPWELARTCRIGSPEPCGACPACIARAEAFAVVGCEDPLGIVSKSH